MDQEALVVRSEDSPKRAFQEFHVAQQRKTTRATEYHPGRPAAECPGRSCAWHSLRISWLDCRI